MLKNRKDLFTTGFDEIYYCLPPEASRRSYDFIDQLKQIVPNIHIIFGLFESKHLFTNTLPKLFVVDDQMTQLSRNNFILQVFTRTSHHENATIICSTQSYFECNKIIRDNVSYKIIFHDPTSDVVIRNVSSQMSVEFRTAKSESSFLANCFEALKQNFPHDNYPYLIIDSHYRSGNNLCRVRSKILPNKYGIIEPICFFKNLHYK